MSKLFKRAKVQLSLADDCYRRFSEDDAYVDACCYCLQQSIELSLKYIVELHGEDYAENHDLRANLNKLARMEISIPMVEELRRMSSTLYSWATESRYRDSFIALTTDIDLAREIAISLVDYINSISTQSEYIAPSEYPDGRLAPLE